MIHNRPFSVTGCKMVPMNKIPSVVIVGRPNVGKSTLFNKMTGLRRSIVTDEPGITRDRIYGEAEWRGKRFEVVDTGGMVVGEPAELPARIVDQAEVALRDADQIILVVDGRSELTASDRELAQLLWRKGKPLVLAVNKTDKHTLIDKAQSFYELGISRLIPVSAEHALGIDELLEEITKDFPEAEEQTKQKEINVAIIGRPNVGKSTLLNRLAQAERSIVSEIAGTTRDAVDTLVEHEGTRYRLVDTAGIRRKGKTELVAEKLSVVMARRHIRLCDVALLIVDGAQGITAADATIAGYAHEAGKSVIIVFNKWDEVEQKREKAKEMGLEADRRMKYLDYAPRIFISAKTGLGIGKLFTMMRAVSTARQMRIPTGELNRFLHSIDLQRATTPIRSRPKIYYMTQAAASPPALFCLQTRHANCISRSKDF